MRFRCAAASTSSRCPASNMPRSWSTSNFRSVSTYLGSSAISSSVEPPDQHRAMGFGSLTKLCGTGPGSLFPACYIQSPQLVARARRPAAPQYRVLESRGPRYRLTASRILHAIFDDPTGQACGNVNTASPPMLKSPVRFLRHLLPKYPHGSSHWTKLQPGRRSSQRSIRVRVLTCWPDR